jgi:hypothetical protein
MSANQTLARSDARDGFPSWASNRAIATVVESILRTASRPFRRPDLIWFGLNDHLLADIGETRTEAEVEAARCVWRTPLGRWPTAGSRRTWASRGFHPAGSTDAAALGKGPGKIGLAPAKF